MACMNFKFVYFIKNIWVGSLFIKTGLSPLYVIEMIIKFCVSLEFCVFLDIILFYFLFYGINSLNFY